MRIENIEKENICAIKDAIHIRGRQFALQICSVKDGSRAKN